MATKVLVVDDDQEIVRTVRAYLEQSGFQVVSAHDGNTALAAFQQSRPDLVVLDLMMPGLDGFEVARRLRQQSAVPIVILTARVDETDKLIGLELGADDYVTKPFGPRELVARIRAVLRRTQGGPARPALLQAGGIVLDTQAHTVSREGKPVDLTPSEFSLLESLMANAGRVMTRLQLIEKAFGYTYDGFERTVDAHIKNLRQKIEADPKDPTCIVTVYGVGYRFAEAANAK